MSFYDHPDRQWDGVSGAPARPVGEPSNLRGLSTALTILLAAIALVSVLAVLAHAGRIGYIDEVDETGSIDRDRADAADGFVVVSSLVLWFLVGAAIASVFIVWQYRHAKNARILGADGGLASPGWAVGGWFIPIANAFIPARNLYTTARYSHAERRAPGIVVVWAVVFGLAYALRLIASPPQDATDADYLDLLRVSDSLALAAHILYIAAAVLAIVMVRGLSARQHAALDARLAMVSAQPQAYGTWPAPPPYGQPPYGQAPYGQQPYGYAQPQPQPPVYGQPPSGPPSQNPPPSPFAPGSDAAPTPPAPPPVPPSSTP
jgi:hypothetical protein